MSKRKVVRIVSFVLAGFLFLGGVILREHAVSEGYRRRIELGYQRAFSELASSSDRLRTSLLTCVRHESPGAFSSVCAEAYAQAEAAQSALSALPFSGAGAEKTADYLSRAGDYVRAMSRKAASGGSLTEEERANLASLAESADLLADNLAELYGGLRSGDIVFERGAGTENASVSDSFFSMESEFPALPPFTYDGALSAHLEERRPALLENAAEIDEEEAVERIAAFTGMAGERFTVDFKRDGDIPVYVLSALSLHGELFAEVSARGGVVTRITNTRPVGEGIVSVEDGVRLAEKFVVSHGYDSLKRGRERVEGGCVTVPFTHNEGGVDCCPDLVEVTVALDTGGVVGFNAEGYVMSHRGRELSEPSVSEEDARSGLSEGLNVLSSGRAVIESAGKNELLCHEFECESGDGRRCLLYVNGETGDEEKLTMLE
ncbi:MAG: germination protein YpeB [Oscillospiraceae bacterium]|nr:germination protein YpeB [Oscillospiraceae bacterium]